MRRIRTRLLLVAVAAALALFVINLPGQAPGGNPPDELLAYLELPERATVTPTQRLRYGVSTVPGDSYVPQQAIVQFKADATAADRRRLLRQLGASTVRRIGRDANTVLLRLPKSLQVADALQAISVSDVVESAEPNFIYHKNALPNDPDFANYWGLDNTGQTGGVPDVDIDAPEAWDQATGSPGVLIGVIDTGIDYNHPDLATNAWINPGEIPDNGLDDDGNGWADDVHGIDTFNDDSDPMDDEGHGTHVSGTIAASGNNGLGGAGVMWRARLIGCKFLGANGIGYLDGALECLDYFIALKDAGFNIALTNNSWGGGGYSAMLENRIAEHANRDMLFVAAAGNSGLDADVYAHYPSGYSADNIVSVAAINASGDLASFSNYGATSVDIAAPGVQILSTLPGSSWGYASGTSMASPHVAGVAGLLKANEPGISMAEVRDILLATGTPDARYEGRMVTGSRLRIDLPDVDDDGDGMPNRWEERYGLNPADPGDAALDLDTDGLTNLEEYQAGSDPSIADTDGDGLTDFDEVRNVGTDPALTDTDRDGLSDGDEVQVHGTNPLSGDTDGDTLGDAEELNDYGTNPANADTDADGLPDGWEVENGFDPLTSGDELADADGDGLSNGAEFAAGTNPHSSDTDSDGLTDFEEVNILGTNPLDSDTDADGMDDAWEVDTGLNPIDPADALLDADNDGFSNLLEYLRGTDPNNPDSFPTLDTWNAFQGNAQHNGFAPLTTTTADFDERWSASVPGFYSYQSNPVSGGFRLFYSSNNYPDAAIGSLSMANGARLWESVLPGSGYIEPPVYDETGVIAPTTSYGIDSDLRAYDSSTGSDVDLYPTTQPVYFTEVVPFEDVLYYLDGNNVIARDIATGTEQWSTGLSITGYLDPPVLAANASWVVLQENDNLHVIARSDGELLHSIPTSECTSYSSLSVILDGDTAYSTANGCASRVDLLSGQFDWQVDTDGRGDAAPALDQTSLYVAGYSGFGVLDKATGELRWSSVEVVTDASFNVVVTLDHAFVSDYSRTVAFDLQTRQLVWTHDRTGRLAVTDDAALVIAGTYDSMLSAVSLDGDSDGDGMPNWWERFHRLDFSDPADAAGDPDADGLDNLSEFGRGTNPRNSDSDGDGLIDGDEVNTIGTDPANFDTDGDGLDDGDEINVYGTDPLDIDTDGDEISDGDEVNVYGTDPTDPASVPDLLRSYRQSFEDGIPAEWVTPPDADAGWTIADTRATDGSFSLRASDAGHGLSAVVEWSDLFASGELAFDARFIDFDCCANFKMYIDGQEVLWFYPSEWQRYTFPIPAGEHTIRFEYTRWGSTSSSTDGAWVDAVEFYVPKPIASGLDNIVATSWGSLAEVTADGQLTRSIVPLPGVGYSYGMAIGENHDVYIAEAPTLHRYDPATEAVSTTEYGLWQTWYGAGIAAIGDRIYATNSELNYGILVFDLNGEYQTSGLENTLYVDVYAAADGSLYALRSDGFFVDRISVPDMVVQSTVTLNHYARSLAVNTAGDIYVSRSERFLDRYDSNGNLIASAESSDAFGLGDLAVADNGTVYASDWSGGIAVYSPVPELLDHFDTDRLGMWVSSVTAVRREGADLDSDGLADWWEAVNQLDSTNPGDAGLDPDGDLLTNSEEYALGTNPNEPDTDLDGLTDGEERDIYGTNPRLADSDYDGLGDATEVRDAGTDPNNRDSDGDGLDDGFEFEELGTNPLSPDTDGDGLPDGWEFDNGLDPSDSADAVLDNDSDGLSNLREYEIGTRFDLADTDRDGLFDGDEVDTTTTDPLLRDTDGDGLPDGWEVSYGLDPLLASDADSDLDGDGYSNVYEYYANSDPTSVDSVPASRPWSTHQGGPDHRGFVPVRVQPTSFEELWTIQPFSDPNFYGLGQVAATGSSAWVSTESYFGYQALAAIDAATGEIRWSYEFGPVYEVSPPAFADNRVYVQTSGHEDSFLWAFDADTGDLSFQASYSSQWPLLRAPAPFEGDVFGYAGYYGGVASFSGSGATVNWQQDLDFFDNWSPAVDETSVYAYAGTGLSVIDRLTGDLVEQLADPGYLWNGYTASGSPVRDYAGNIIITQGNRIVAFDIASGTVAWEVETAGTLTQATLVGDTVLVAHDDTLIAYDSGSGEERWRVLLPDYVAFSMVGTVDHLFLASFNATYAIDLATQEIVWSFPRGGELTLAPAGTLFIAGTDFRLTAIRLAQDLDGDGMPDGWEELNGFDSGDPADGALDADGDGLSNVGEYAAGTNPRAVDTDSDGLGDGDEVSGHGTNPLSADTDADGLPDGWEVVHGLQPLINDAAGDPDGDGATNRQEYDAGTDPTDPASAPDTGTPPPSPPSPPSPPPPSTGGGSGSGGGGGGALSPAALLLLLVTWARRREPTLVFGPRSFPRPSRSTRKPGSCGCRRRNAAGPARYKSCS